jgi:GSH-dependent disulfide-bond oxidoreductase
MFDLYTWATPNGRKISVMLEELGADYVIHPVDITKNDQFRREFLALNRNNKIPVLVDSEGPDGAPLVLAESGAILIYLAEKFVSPLLPKGPAERSRTMQWLMFQMGGIGPMFGQLHHFRRYASDQTYALGRYQKEVHRLYGVLNAQLAESDFLNGSAYSIADVATYPWVDRNALHDIGWSVYPHVKRWFDAIGDRPAVRRGMAIPTVS